MSRPKRQEPGRVSVDWPGVDRVIPYPRSRHQRQPTMEWSNSSIHFAHHNLQQLVVRGNWIWGYPSTNPNSCIVVRPHQLSPTKPCRIRERPTSLTMQHHQREHRHDGEGARGTFFHSVNIANRVAAVHGLAPSQCPTAIGGEGRQRRRTAGKPPLASTERPRDFHRV
ncbi:hypothetical protein D1007_19181 [Hordeum vulgare]|nr:hypothetical protein D1007_19181 [Hordeum vulgare]